MGNIKPELIPLGGEQLFDKNGIPNANPFAPKAMADNAYKSSSIMPIVDANRDNTIKQVEKKYNVDEKEAARVVSTTPYADLWSLNVPQSLMHCRKL